MTTPTPQVLGLKSTRQEPHLDYLSQDLERVGANRLASVGIVRAGISIFVCLNLVGATLGTLE